MKSRRNYYRLLRVQPDASLEIIKHSYRTLMQKLQHHPDLGGDEWNASHINMAYATLRDPKKRAAYDQKLFKQQNIETVSRGHLGKTPKTFRTKRKQAGNQRNYYRVLQVQPDAELAVIEASYKLLKRNPKANKELLDEAWKTLHSEAKRRQYDQHLMDAKPSKRANDYQAKTKQKPDQAHREKPSAKPQSNAKPNQKDENASKGAENKQQQCSDKTESTRSTKGQRHTTKTHAYNTNSGHSCFFCKTPYSHSDYAHRHEYCDECGSPLLLLAKGYAKLPRRSVARAKTRKPAAIYTSWPSTPTRVALSDLSPTGVGFVSKRPLVVGSMVKIDAEDFKAVAELKYCKAIGPFSKVGLRFITIQFFQQRGSFISTSA